MSENKRYYWLKLKENFFDDDTISFIEEQDNGKEYCLFYLKLCLKSLRADGRLMRLVGDNLIPYDVKSLAKLTNTDQDTVRVALNLFQQIGLVNVLNTGEIFMTQLEELVGSETNKAEKMRAKRARDKLEGNNVTQMLPERYPEYRDKSIEIETEIEIKKPRPSSRFVKPTLDEVSQYCLERHNSVDPQAFIDFYESKGWMIGKNKMKDWKATVRTWERNSKKPTGKTADERLGISGNSSSYFQMFEDEDKW